MVHGLTKKILFYIYKTGFYTRTTLVLHLDGTKNKPLLARQHTNTDLLDDNMVGSLGRHVFILDRLNVSNV